MFKATGWMYMYLCPCLWGTCECVQCCDWQEKKDILFMNKKTDFDILKEHYQ